MVKKSVFFLVFLVFTFACQNNTMKQMKVRDFVDTVGFAHKAQQVDTLLSRIDQMFGQKIKHIKDSLGITPSTTWKVAISPHDDHAYASYLYPLLLQNIKAKKLIIFGVAHKAWKLGLKDSLVFGSFDYWRGAFGNVKISDLRDEIISLLPKQDYMINDSMVAIEHSIEAFLPFLQKFVGPYIEIVPILVPYMSYDRMNQIAPDLARAIATVMKKHNLQWGKDLAIIISTDAVHYGDQNWGGKNFAYYGSDSAGYKKAVEHEHEIISTLTGRITPEKIKQFTQYTVQDTNYMEYKWTWCGRYSVPMGLLTAYYLSKELNEPLEGTLLDYATSIDHPTVPVKDIGMGTTAPANIHHWVGYAAIGYK